MDKAAPKPVPERTATYEPPRLEQVGTLRDLVGKTGPATDNPSPNPRKC